MDKRFLIFLAVAAVIMIVTPRLFPPSRVSSRSAKGVDTGLTAQPRPAVVAADSGHAAVSPIAAGTAAPLPAPSPPAHADTIVVRTARVRYRFTTVGASLLGAELNDYRALTKEGGLVELARPGVPLIGLGLLSAARDTSWLNRITFTADTSAVAGAVPVLRFRGVADGDTVAIAYTFSPDSYLVRVAGAVTGPTSAAGPRALLLSMQEGLRSEEADTVEDERHLSYVAKPLRDDPTGVDFRKLDPGQTRFEDGPLDWVASKNKYFILVAMSDTARMPFAGTVLEGLPRSASKAATRASATIVQPLTQDGAFAFTIYSGPQEWRRLLALGHDLQNVNPFGGPFRAIIQPAATLLMRTLLWAHDRFHVNYGWVVVIFGVALRLILWPLNQSAMRAQLKVQRIQPELQAIQKRYKNTPDKLTAEMTRLYREHGMSPFSPLAGCIPMLIPMPVLYALYYVFQNTIEFRGVSFLWLVDISQRDPYYILPVVMGISMFLLSWIGLRVSPPNAQAKMMAYAMPVAMTFLFKNFAAGLNLYYAVQNLAALPQQWLIAQERAKVGLPATSAGPAGGTKKGEVGT